MIYALAYTHYLCIQLLYSFWCGHTIQLDKFIVPKQLWPTEGKKAKENDVIIEQLIAKQIQTRKITTEEGDKNFLANLMRRKRRS
jgi:hypothetical protein